LSGGIQELFCLDNINEKYILLTLVLMRDMYL
jgi:hypothetical protein